MIPNWVYKMPWPIIRELANDFSLDPLFIAAMIMTESSGITCKIRYEPKWKYAYNEFTFAQLTGVTKITEFHGQKMSWGIAQVMGTVARERGFKGLFPELCNPAIGLLYGVKHLKIKADRYGNDAATLYAAYNGGHPRIKANGKFKNQDNVDRFMKFYREIKDF